jgi:hypothetical protein
MGYKKREEVVEVTEIDGGVDSELFGDDGKILLNEGAVFVQWR